MELQQARELYKNATIAIEVKDNDTGYKCISFITDGRWIDIHIEHNQKPYAMEENPSETHHWHKIAELTCDLYSHESYKWLKKCF